MIIFSGLVKNSHKGTTKHLILKKGLCKFSFQKPSPNQQTPNYYQTLEISQQASFDEIKKKFKQLSKVYHPDFNKGKESKFHEIQKAYKILSEFKSRKHHDLNLGIKNSLWESEEFKLNSDQFQNQAIDEFLKSNQTRNREIKSLQEKLAERFRVQIEQEMRDKQTLRAMLFPSIGFACLWGIWNFFQYIIINYKGQQSHDVKSYEGDKKLSSVPINIR